MLAVSLFARICVYVACVHCNSKNCRHIWTKLSALILASDLEQNDHRL